MSIFKREAPHHYIPIHHDNVSSKDWVVLLEAGTMVGGSGEKLRVALCTRERKIVAKYNIFLRRQHFLVVEGYDPRIHTLYFCPQLYRLDQEGKPVALDGDEIGKLLARSVRDAVADRRPWYDPGDRLPGDPIISPTQEKADFESLVVQDTPVRDLAA
jgi:hypothetical protein